MTFRRFIRRLAVSRLPLLVFLGAWILLLPLPRGNGITICACGDCGIEYMGQDRQDGCHDHEAPLGKETSHCHHLSLDDQIGLPLIDPDRKFFPAAGVFDLPSSEVLPGWLIARDFSGLDPPREADRLSPFCLEYLGKSISLLC
jgi:hypothetical protein